MPETDETVEPPVKKTRIEKIAGPAVWFGCFVIWPGAQLATAYLSYKSFDKQLAIAQLKLAAKDQ